MTEDDLTGDAPDSGADRPTDGDAPDSDTDRPTRDDATRDDVTGPGPSDSEPTPELTHTDAQGAVDVVDVGAKPDVDRRAVARGTIRLRPETITAIADNEIGKGDVLATARIGAIQAVKHTWETIPLCHQIPITNVETEFDLGDDRVDLEVAVETTGKTGCEMEALEGVSTGLNVVWDMVKSAEKDAAGQYPATRIEAIEVVEKQKDAVE